MPFQANTVCQGDGLELLEEIGADRVRVAFFDPQYRGVLDKLRYGNEGARQRERAALAQMPEATIRAFVHGISSCLLPSGYLFLWVDKWHLCQGVGHWITDTDLRIVDLVTWDKGRIGMGYRTRRRSEYCLVIQKTPVRAKSTWRLHDIPDVWEERVPRGIHPHFKPIGLQARLLEATTAPGDLVVDPAAGSFSVLAACRALPDRIFLGTDLCPRPCPETGISA